MPRITIVLRGPHLTQRCPYPLPLSHSLARFTVIMSCSCKFCASPSACSDCLQLGTAIENCAKSFDGEWRREEGGGKGRTRESEGERESKRGKGTGGRGWGQAVSGATRRTLPGSVPGPLPAARCLIPYRTLPLSVSFALSHSLLCCFTFSLLLSLYVF